MPNLVPMERNFEEYPVFEVGRRVKKGGDPIFFSRTYESPVKTDLDLDVEDDKGMAFDQSWRLQVSNELGRPGVTEQDFYVAVMVLLDRGGGMPPDRELDLSLYEIARLCGRSRSQKDYEYIKEGLRRIESTHAVSRQAFWSATRQAHIDRSVNPWNTHFRDYKEIRGNRSLTTGRHTISFTTAFAKSIEDGYVSFLDTDFYFSLSLPTSKRLCRLLSACAMTTAPRSNPRWEVEITQLRDQFPLSKNYVYRSKIEEKLFPAHEELVAGGYLLDFSLEKREDGVYACYEINRRFAELRNDQLLETSPTNRPAMEMMASVGISRKVQLESIKKYSPDLCLKIAAMFPYQKWPDNPMGAFKAALQDPDTHLPRWETNVHRHSQSEIQSDPLTHPAPDTTEASFDLAAGDGDEKPRREPPEPDPEAQDLWKKALDIVSEEIDTPSFNVWFEGTVPIKVEDEVLTIAVPNSFAREYISDRFKNQLEAALTAQLGVDATLRILVHGQRPETNTATTTTPETTRAPRKEGR